MAKKAAVLMLSVARETFAHNGEPNRTAQHDVGLASENMALEAVSLGLVLHQMAGFDTARAREQFKIPEGFTPMAMIATGYRFRGDLSALPEKIRTRETTVRTRLAISEIAFAGVWNAKW